MQRIQLKVNGFVVSIVQGEGTYSDDGTVEVGVFDERGTWFHPEPDMDDDVLGYVDAERLARILKTVMEYNREET